jgi:hypothetical protein
VGLQVSLNRPARLILASRGMLLFFLGLRFVCIDFSCPVNAVPQSVVDAYLRRNPVMREAWEASGYRLGE